MLAFRNPDAAASAVRRLEGVSEPGVGEFLSELLAGTPDPDSGLQNLERWLVASAAPALQLQAMRSDPHAARVLAMVLASSQPLADALIQSPETASILFDAGELGRTLTAEAVVAEGRLLLKSATSYSHSLDRLRYLKQRWTLAIAANDLTGAWAPSVVWEAISNLAEGVIGLALETTWQEWSPRKSIEEPCPLSVVAFGKLGGHELNYSSDIDLAYIISPGAKTSDEDLTRFAEAFGRAVMDRMGRGMLYRIDLRLRPYGAAGAIVRSMESYENYYKLYAEPWEVQALLRSRVVAGGLDNQWEALRQTACFRAPLGEMALESVLAMRSRDEERASPEDIKRSPGGIRSAEFLVQILQLLHGAKDDNLRFQSTLAALEALEQKGLLDHASAQALLNAYTFLRQVEHRIQLLDDRQNHTLPTYPETQEKLAKLLQEPSWPSLQQRIETARRTIETLYQSLLHPEQSQAGKPYRQAVAETLGRLAPPALQWFDPFEGSEAFYRSLAENADSLARVQRVLEQGPALVQSFKSSISLTEELLSGELLEEPAAGASALPSESNKLAGHVAAEWTATLTRWLFSEEPSTAAAPIARICERALQHIYGRLGAPFDVIALGSFGAMTQAPTSDCDLLLLVSSIDQHRQAEVAAEAFLGAINQLRRFGSPISIDLRLRPEGRQGLLVRTYEGFSTYELESMEMWERFALGEARLVAGNPEAEALVRRAAFAQPLTPERLKELRSMKHRIETERIQPQLMHRHVKLGSGGLSDIEWLLHILEMRYPSALDAMTWRPLRERLGKLAEARIMTLLETEELAFAHTHLQSVRTSIALLGFEADLVPENPDKLDRLAQARQAENGNEFLKEHLAVTERVRAIYDEAMERLRA